MRFPLEEQRLFISLTKGLSLKIYQLAQIQFFRNEAKRTSLTPLTQTPKVLTLMKYMCLLL